MPFDTKYFKDIEVDLLERIDNLDDELDGRLIHSENFQALNTILPKYKEKVDLIVVDTAHGHTKKVAEILDKMSVGVINQDIAETKNNEIGRLFISLKKLILNLNCFRVCSKEMSSIVEIVVCFRPQQEKGSQGQGPRDGDGVGLAQCP